MPQGDLKANKGLRDDVKRATDELMGKMRELSDTLATVASAQQQQEFAKVGRGNTIWLHFSSTFTLLLFLVLLPEDYVQIEWIQIWKRIISTEKIAYLSKVKSV